MTRSAVNLGPLLARHTPGEPWHCEANFVTCHVGHLYRVADTQFRSDARGMEGPTFYECQKCVPPSYFVALYVARPYPLVTCYSLAERCYREWVAEPFLLATPELLHVLCDPQGRSLNPQWRAPR